MTRREIVSHFKKAEKFFSKPQKNNTGLCYYFKYERKLRYKEVNELERFWRPHKTTPNKSVMDFDNQEERLEAIRKIIKENESKMNTLHWIAIALFASALVSGLLLFIEATFLLFTTGVLVLAIATYVKDRAESRN
mgnify:FL=1